LSRRTVEQVPYRHISNWIPDYDIRGLAGQAIITLKIKIVEALRADFYYGQVGGGLVNWGD
jgi:hypothetical protein